jgi:hypothetical protein
MFEIPTSTSGFMLMSLYSRIGINISLWLPHQPGDSCKYYLVLVKQEEFFNEETTDEKFSGYSLCIRDFTHQILPNIEGIGKYNKSNWQLGMLTQRVGFERFGTFAFLTKAPLHTWLLS